MRDLMVKYGLLQEADGFRGTGAQEVEG
jgi:hypothetical protein